MCTPFMIDRVELLHHSDILLKMKLSHYRGRQHVFVVMWCGYRVGDRATTRIWKIDVSINGHLQFVLVK